MAHGVSIQDVFLTQKCVNGISVRFAKSETRDFQGLLLLVPCIMASNYRVRGKGLVGIPCIIWEPFWHHNTRFVLAVKTRVWIGVKSACLDLLHEPCAQLSVMSQFQRDSSNGGVYVSDIVTGWRWGRDGWHTRNMQLVCQTHGEIKQAALANVTLPATLSLGVWR